jgi:hypothetical protein
VTVLALPYLVWLIRTDASVVPHVMAFADPRGSAMQGAKSLGALLLAAAGIAILSLVNSRWFDRKEEDAPAIFRPPVGLISRDFVYFFAFAPALLGCLISTLYGLDHVASGAGIVLLMSGLAVTVACGDLAYIRRQRVLRSVWAALVLMPALAVILPALLIPWVATSEVATSFPAIAMGRFFDESFERRTNQRLATVSGDAQLASLMTLSARRPHLFLAATPERTPWLNQDKFNQSGGVVVWRAADTDGAPPADIARQFPGLVPEVPRSFDRLVNGRQPPFRVGWAIIRPKAP